MPLLRAPTTRLDDGVIALRLFEAGDRAVFELAAQPGGNDGVWITLPRRNPARSLAEHIAGWSTAGAVGANLAIVPSKGGRPLGVVYFTPRSPDSVELTYGVAPAHRGQGVATRAARLAAEWLLPDGLWKQVELRIADDAVASQHVAVKAGFQLAGWVRTYVDSLRKEFEDCLYLITAITPGS